MNCGLWNSEEDWEECVWHDCVGTLSNHLSEFVQASICISIPKEHHRFILGKNGNKLKDLEKATATKISVPNMADSSDKITITGTKEGIEKAVHEIKVTSDEQVFIQMLFEMSVKLV
jgi:predicted PilT family ATPase